MEGGDGGGNGCPFLVEVVRISDPSQHITSLSSRGSLVGVRAFLEKNW